MPEIY
jgi:chromosome segregation protein